MQLDPRRAWWGVMLVSTVVIGLTTAYLLDLLTGLQKLGFLGVLLFVIFVGDVLVALGMQKVAPTRISIGPGERETCDDLPAETATAIAHFDGNTGRVSVRGETWNARTESDSAQSAIRRGDIVRVEGRDGLTLVVSPAET